MKQNGTPAAEIDSMRVPPRPDYPSDSLVFGFRIAGATGVLDDVAMPTPEPTPLLYNNTELTFLMRRSEANFKNTWIGAEGDEDKSLFLLSLSRLYHQLPYVQFPLFYLSSEQPPLGLDRPFFYFTISQTSRHSPRVITTR
ncbi:hypothetical protein BDM02DRAFT_3122113 [Thelephora ganbajun]|uniref:Uncharacterized protein n=1 Tax=Thelephora ganbajun TaxID=370292 RepID=A0ACB6Z408_THEGA|nr:hypothetical protein BDM02DRAFT_3122113 [Thelephora ganbajun]